MSKDEKKTQHSFERIFSDDSTHAIAVETNLLTLGLYSARLITCLTGIPEDQTFEYMYRLMNDVQNGHTISPEEIEALAAIMMEMSREELANGEHLQ